MKAVRTLFFAFAAVVTASAALGAPPAGKSPERAVPLSSVPKPAIDSARKALGFTPAKAKIVSGSNPQEWILTTKNGLGEEIGIYVRADGTVVKRADEDNDEDE